MTFLFQNWFQLTDAEEKLDYEGAEDDIKEIKGGVKEMSDDEASSEEVGLM